MMLSWRCGGDPGLFRVGPQESADLLPCRARSPNARLSFSARSENGPYVRKKQIGFSSKSAEKGPCLLKIFIDADGCPVKPEIYRVAKRYGLKVNLVSNSPMRAPQENWLEVVIVEGQFNAADDWIVGHVGANDIVITGDIPLASRCLEKDARVLAPAGRLFTKESIGEALSRRELLSHLRDLGTITGGPAPFEKRDRSRFLQRLDETIQAVRSRKPEAMKGE